MKAKYDTLDDFLKAFGLECADDTEKKLIEDIALDADNKIYFKIGRESSCWHFDMLACMQNYFIIRQLTLQKNELLQNNELSQQIIEQNNENNELNRKILKQNEQIIEQNDTLVEQNKQIIALLTKISEK